MHHALSVVNYIVGHDQRTSNCAASLCTCKSCSLKHTSTHHVSELHASNVLQYDIDYHVCHTCVCVCVCVCARSSGVVSEAPLAIYARRECVTAWSECVSANARR